MDPLPEAEGLFCFYLGGKSLSFYSAPSRIPTFPCFVHEGGTKVYQYISDILVGGSDVHHRELDSDNYHSGNYQLLNIIIII